MTEITKKVSEDWNNLGPKDKEEYEKKAAAAKVHHEKEVKDYEAKYGKIEKKKRGSKKEKESKKASKKKK